MAASSASAAPAGPVYIYNGVSNLKALKDINLHGANLFFNGSFRVEDLRDVDLIGATIFLNGQLQVRDFKAVKQCADLE
jgi:hypothetical protein